MQNLVEFGQKQQEELMRRQEELQHAHDHLVENSRYILEAQVCNCKYDILKQLFCLLSVIGN